VTLVGAAAVTPTLGQDVAPAVGSTNSRAQSAASIPDLSGIWGRNWIDFPKIRDEILEDAAERDFPRILGSTTVPGFPSTGSSGDFLPVGWDFRGFQTQIRRWRLIVRVPKSTTSARDHDVSEMAPPSRMMRAHRSRIAANMSNMAAPICKKICRPWRTILPAV
jgi:hypothetical protein